MKRLSKAKLGLLALALLSSCARPHATSTPPPAAVSPAPGASRISPSPYGYIYTPAPETLKDSSAPQILEVDLNDRVLTAPGPVHVRVLTNLHVSSVTVLAPTLGQLALPQQAQGIFGGDNELPSVPFFFHHRNYRVEFVATAPDGRSARVAIPITLR